MSSSGWLDKRQIHVTYEELPAIYQEEAIPPEVKELARDSLTAGRKSALAVRIILFPAYVIQGVRFLSVLPGSALAFRALLLEACWNSGAALLIS